MVSQRTLVVAAALLSASGADAFAQSVCEPLPLTLYEDRIVNQGTGANGPPTRTAIPKNFQPWWNQDLGQRQYGDSNELPVSLPRLTAGSLQYSNQIRVFSDLPLIRETQIAEAWGAFDWRVFAETRYRKTSDPVGNELTTGGPLRFREQDWSYAGGLRQRNLHGGQFEISQEFGYRDNNSIFFQPPDQGRSRLVMSYTQPLWRGAGTYYNTSPVVLAELDTGAANDEFSRQLQTHLLEVAKSYWALYAERAILLQRIKLVQESERLYDLLKKREKIDVVGAQLVRAESAVAVRRSFLARTRMAIRNAQSRIVTLVNDPSLSSVPAMEMLPLTPPSVDAVEISMQDSMFNALHFRPEIAQSMKRIEAAGRRLDIAGNELRPQLDAVLETYVAGLRGSSSVGGAFVDQFSVGEPSYTVGLVFEMPLKNITAEARYRRRALELRQLRSQLSNTIEEVLLEVQVAVREVQTAFDDMHTKFVAMQANSKEVAALGRQWEISAGNNASAIFLLDNLLNAQNRLAIAEQQFVNAQVTYNLALVNWRRAVGTMLSYERVDIGRAYDGCLPRLDPLQDQTLMNGVPVESLQEPDGALIVPAPEGALIVPADNVPLNRTNR